MTFKDQVVRPVRKLLKRGVRLPAGGQWDIGPVGGVPTLALTLPAEVLGGSLLSDRVAAPWFLLCFAYWYAQVTSAEPRLRLDVQGTFPASSKARQHARRSWIALEVLQWALGDRLEVLGAPAQRWPDQPRFNAPEHERDHAEGRGNREHRVEAQLCREPQHAQAFSAAVAPILGFKRQLPLGLFGGQKARATAWTPGGGAQADLWTRSPKGDCFHLFELKAAGNAKVNILPELLCYAWLVHRARVGLPDGTPVIGGGAGLDAARRAERLRAWTLAPTLHPLVMSHGRSPLEWLAEGLRGQVELGALFYHHRQGREGFGAWRFGEGWGPHFFTK